VTQALAFSLVFLAGVLLSGAAWGSEIRAAAGDDFAAIQRNPRTERYLADFERAVETTLDSMDPETGLLRIAGLPDPKQFDWSIARLDRFARKRLITPEYSKYYRLSRGSAAAIGLLGEAYALPLSRFHHDPRLLTAVRRGLEAFTAHQDPSGEWIFCPIRFSTVYGSHEMAWRLEPLLRAFVSVKADLSPEEHDRYGGMLEKATDFLLHTPCLHECNRGVVWAGVMALAYAMLGKPEYLDAARQNWAHVIPYVFRDDGQVLEGPGPDHGYSAVSLRYAFLYRLMSGDATADEILIRSLRWVPRLYDAVGVPFTGMSTRTNITDGNRLEAYLPALEYYADREPMFDRLAGDFIHYLEDRGLAFAGSHGGAYALRAALFHRARPDVSEAEVLDCFQVYADDVSIYAAVRRRYQTVINLRSRQPQNGLQMWTYGREKPVVCPTRDLASGTETWGYTSWLTDARGDEAYRICHSDLEALAVERGGHYDFYIFSPVSTVVIYAGPHRQRKTRWVLSKQEVAEPTLLEGRVGFAGQSAALYYGGSPPRLRETSETRLLEFERDGGFDWYAFSGAAFREESVGDAPDGIVAFGFTDATGSYRVLANPSSATRKGRIETTWPERRTLDVELGGKEVRVTAVTPPSSS